MSKPLLILAFKTYLNYEQLDNLKRKFEEKGVDVILVNGEVDIKLLSDKNEAAKLFEIKSGELEQLKKYLDE